MTTKTMTPLVAQQFRASARARREVLIDNHLAESGGVTQMNVLTEDASSRPGVMMVEGVVGWVGKPTANKRLYERRIMEREINRLQEKIGRGANLAAVDHPGDGKSRVMEAGAICRGLSLREDGAIIGTYEIVDDAPGGQALAAFLRRGAAIGMSSRGIGSTSIDAEGNHVVGEDFKLHAFDFVADPACKDAYPVLVSEDTDLSEVTEDHLRAQFPGLIEEIEHRARQVGFDTAEPEVREILESEFERAIPEAKDRIRDEVWLEAMAEAREQLREDFAAKLVRALQHLKQEAISIVRSELMADPEVAGAKRFVEELATKLLPYRPTPDQKALLSAQAEETAELQEQFQQLHRHLEQSEALRAQAEQKARSMGYRLFIERSLQGFEDADEMRELIGNPDTYASVEELQDRVRAVCKQVVAHKSEAEERAAAQAEAEWKVKSHKAELAERKAHLAQEQLEALKAEFAQRAEALVEQVQVRSASKDEQLQEAYARIEALERGLNEARHVASEQHAQAQFANLVAFAERRTLGHPRRDDIMAMVHSGRIETKAAVQQIAEEWDQRASEPGGVDERIRRAMSTGVEAPSEDDRSKFNQLMEDRQPVPGLENFDTTMGELRALAGIRRNGNRRF